MTVFRWIIGVVFGLLAVGSAISLVLFLAFDIQLWLERARSLRRGAYLAGLLWFNIEVWGRVIWTIAHW